MWSDVIVVLSPPGGQHSGLLYSCKDLAVEQFVSELPVEAFDVSVLPGAPTFDEQRAYAQPREPGPDSPGYEGFHIANSCTGKDSAGILC